MTSIETLATFFGWCTVLNFGLLIFVVLVWMVVKAFFSRTIAKMFGVSENDARITILRVVMQYRTGIVLLNLVPYIALKIMA